ncbi:MAG: hypothetical protein ACF787_11785 [Rhodopirellula sp. JB053]
MPVGFLGVVIAGLFASGILACGIATADETTEASAAATVAETAIVETSRADAPPAESDVAAAVGSPSDDQRNEGASPPAANSPVGLRFSFNAAPWRDVIQWVA